VCLTRSQFSCKMKKMLRISCRKQNKMQFWVAFSRHTNYISVRANISQAQPGKTKQQLLPYEKRSTRRGLRSASGDLRGLPRNAGLFVVTWGRPSSSTPMRSSFFPHQYRGARPPNGLLTPHSCRRDSSPLRLPCPPTFCLFRIVPLPLPQSLYGGHSWLRRCFHRHVTPPFAAGLLVVT
jgi:hypothetical protein